MYKIDIESAKKSLFETEFPQYVIIELTNYCNLNCIMCPNDVMPRKRGYMDINIFRKVVDEISSKSLKTKLWPAVMGESLMHPEYKKMITYAVDKGIDVVQNTNGTLITDDIIDFFSKSGIKEIIIGVDAFKGETYSKIRVNGNYKKVHDNIIKMLKRFNKPGMPKLILQYIVMPENENETDDFKKYWVSRGAIVKIRPKQGWGKHIDTDLPIEQENRDMPCPWLIRTFNILWDGTISQCDGDACEALGSVGNIKDMSIESAWHGELKKRREKHWNSDFDFVPCKTCKDWQVGLSKFYYPENFDSSDLVIRDISNIQFKKEEH